MRSLVIVIVIASATAQQTYCMLNPLNWFKKTAAPEWTENAFMPKTPTTLSTNANQVAPWTLPESKNVMGYVCGPSSLYYDLATHPTQLNNGAFTDLREPAVVCYEYPTKIWDNSIATKATIMPCCLYNNDGSRLAFKNNTNNKNPLATNQVVLYKPDERKHATINHPDADMYYLAWHNNLLSVACGKNEVQTYVIEDTIHSVYTVENNNIYYWQFAWNPAKNTHLLATAPNNDNETVALWNGTNGKKTTSWKEQFKDSFSFAWSDNGSLLAVCPEQGNTISLREASGTLAATIAMQEKGYYWAKQWVKDLFFILRRGSQSAYVYNSTQGKTTALNHDTWLVDAQISPDGTTIATADNAGKVYCWSPDGTLIKTINVGEANFRIRWNSDGSTLVWQGLRNNWPILAFLTKAALTTPDTK